MDSDSSVFPRYVIIILNELRNFCHDPNHSHGLGSIALKAKYIENGLYCQPEKSLFSPVASLPFSPVGTFNVITADEECFLLKEAYIPEHIPSLMVGVSESDPFFLAPFLCFAKKDWLIFVGYPLGEPFAPATLARAMTAAVQNFRPLSVWLIAPEIPPPFAQPGARQERDEYYRLDLERTELKRGLERQVRQAARALEVERSRLWTPRHQELTDEFLSREKPSPLVTELFLRMPRYLAHSSTAVLLNAWDREKNLSSFYVVELAAQNFSMYVVGCFSKNHYVAHASDLLFFHMIQLSREHQKAHIQLGLGVNEGIRRFKIKWGGTPALPYAFCEYAPDRGGKLPWIRSLLSKR
jgi:hypothetical protein